MDLNYLCDYYIPIVMTACLVIGYCIKHIPWLERISNEYIPAILVLIGAVFACINEGNITFHILVSGAVTGLASTGLYEAFSQIIDKLSERMN